MMPAHQAVRQLSGADFTDPVKLAASFQVAMTIAAGTSFAAALLAWTTIGDDPLSGPGADTTPAAKQLPPSVQRHCAVAGTPLATSPTRGPVPTRQRPRNRDRPVRRPPWRHGGGSAPPATMVRGGLRTGQHAAVDPERLQIPANALRCRCGNGCWRPGLT